MNLETGYMEQLKDMLASLDDYDFSNYLPELVPEEKKYAPLYTVAARSLSTRNCYRKKDWPPRPLLRTCWTRSIRA